jgi:hypothetical protein
MNVDRVITIGKHYRQSLLEVERAMFVDVARDSWNPVSSPTRALGVRKTSMVSTPSQSVKNNDNMPPLAYITCQILWGQWRVTSLLIQGLNSTWTGSILITLNTGQGASPWVSPIGPPVDFSTHWHLVLNNIITPCDHLPNIIQYLPYPIISTTSVTICSTLLSFCTQQCHVDKSGLSVCFHFSLQYVFIICSRNLHTMVPSD